jgi:hypothetical protein
VRPHDRPPLFRDLPLLGVVCGCHGFFGVRFISMVKGFARMAHQAMRCQLLEAPKYGIYPDLLSPLRERLG